MPTIVHTLGENKRDWKRLHEMHEGEFLHGKCYIFARALHQGLGWPLVGFFVKEEGGIRRIDHAGVRSPDGKIFDIRGFVSEDEFAELYAKPPYDIREILEDDLRESRLAVIVEHEIQRARRIAEVLWPGLPWKKLSISKKKAYLDEIEEVSRKHNLWIRAIPGNPSPQIQEGDGHEIGYEICPQADGIAYTTNCCLG